MLLSGVETEAYPGFLSLPTWRAKIAHSCVRVVTCNRDEVEQMKMEPNQAATRNKAP